MRQVLRVIGIPQNWIVGADGVIHLKGIGYDPTEKWEIGMKDAIEKQKPAGGAGNATGSGSGGL